MINKVPILPKIIAIYEKGDISPWRMVVVKYGTYNWKRRCCLIILKG